MQGNFRIKCFISKINSLNEQVLKKKCGMKIIAPDPVVWKMKRNSGINRGVRQECVLNLFYTNHFLSTIPA